MPPVAETTISGDYEDRSWRVDTTDRTIVRRLVSAGYVPLSSSTKIFFSFRIPKGSLTFRTLRDLREMLA